VVEGKGKNINVLINDFRCRRSCPVAGIGFNANQYRRVAGLLILQVRRKFE
jgi:hypothetical protein